MSTQTLDDHPLPGDSGSPAKDVVDWDEEIGKDEVEERSGARKRRGIEKDAEGEEEEEGSGEKKDDDGKVVKKARTRGSVSREPATPIERPSRERKTVERYSASTPTPKTVPIKKGSGTKLRDIPNVFFKLSKRKADESLQHLHRILYGKKAKVRTLKRSILDFSGFVWSSHEDKEKLKLREKLDKCVKDRLFDFCDMFDIPVARATTRKEDILTLLFEFLQSPHVTRDVILEEKEKSGQKHKRKARASIEKKSGEKRRRKKADIIVEENQEEENHEEIHDEDIQEEEPQDEENEENVEKNEEDDVDSHDSSSDDTVSEKEVDLDKNESEEEHVESDPVAVQKSSGKKEVKKEGRSLPNEEKNIKEKEKSESKENTSKKNRRSSKASSSEKSTPTKKASVSRAVSKSKGDKSKSQENLDASNKDKNVNKKQATEAKSQSKSPRARKGNGKGKKATGKSVVSEPSSEELHAAVSDILKEVDFNVATLADILRQLATHFGTDLSHRKSEVKGIIEDVVSNMTDVESGSEEEEANETEGDAALKNPEKGSSGNGEESG